MTQISGRIVAGIGFASAATAQELIDLIAASLAEAGLDATHLAAIATHKRKLGTAIPLHVAAHFGVPLRLLDDGDLTMLGLAEGAAAAAGPLRLTKRKSRYATCALADCAPGFSVASFGQPPISSAAMASSRLATSLAGP
ncbi:cobalamin biosynthesis protein [Devosia ginsengisoli]|uniref:Cobalamin biosynthesis protein n=1 Tax=Devosia ginsengisoli TaxID=400770 RepID=A0A5B8LP40_9HYPH|nr:cobalamin biosynthesis protein [Devosia ginsengisoli]QDZ09374.1 cobalamin biosynthesis protein [Devosia ginsengisoli]